MEELRAEIGAAMVSNVLAAKHLAPSGADMDQHSSYIESWLGVIDVLRKDRKAVFSAAADAQRIADYLLDFHPAYKAAKESSDAIDDIAAATVAPPTSPSPLPKPPVPDAVAALGPMPSHINRRLNKAAVDRIIDVPPNVLEETPSWSPRP